MGHAQMFSRARVRILQDWPELMQEIMHPGRLRFHAHSAAPILHDEIHTLVPRGISCHHQVAFESPELLPEHGDVHETVVRGLAVNSTSALIQHQPRYHKYRAS